MSSDMLSRLTTHLGPLGLQPLGHCATAPEDKLPISGTLILIGPNEPDFWDIFSQSLEYNDDAPDPLDRWSHRTLSQVAKSMDGIALFPFGGPPYQPIFTWALRSGRFWSSPIGFLVHDTAGLFVSFRGALLVPEIFTPDERVNPCVSCSSKPCKTACPVEAFNEGYNVTTCKSHLTSRAGADCMTQGCRARRACPVGRGNRIPAQANHHMKAFL